MPSRRTKKRTRRSRLSFAAVISTHSDKYILAWQMESEEMLKKIIQENDADTRRLLYGENFKARFIPVHKPDSIYLVLLIFQGEPEDFAGIFMNTFVKVHGGIPCENPALLRELSINAWTNYRQSQTS